MINGTYFNGRNFHVINFCDTKKSKKKSGFIFVDLLNISEICESFSCESIFHLSTLSHFYSFLDNRIHLLGHNHITAFVSDRVVLKIKAKHSGKAVWYFQDQILPSTSKSLHYKFPFVFRYGVLFGSILEIHNIQKRHSGRYRISYLVSGCQQHIDINVNVLTKGIFHSYFKLGSH